jgi:hypothetical protein
MSNQLAQYRVVCSTPPGLEEERDLFLAAVASFSERVALPVGVLFPPATFPTALDAVRFQGAIKENIRYAYFFVALFGEDPPNPIYKRFVQYAMECADDPESVLQRVTVFFKESDDISEEMRALRTRFQDQCEVRGYRKKKDLEPQWEELLAAWFAAVQA